MYKHFETIIHREWVPQTNYEIIALKKQMRSVYVCAGHAQGQNQSGTKKDIISREEGRTKTLSQFILQQSKSRAKNFCLHSARQPASIMCPCCEIPLPQKT